MLHILLLILKIIGLIIAVILGILVLLVCVVLFVPVRYELEAASVGAIDTTSMKARVTWLLHLFRADVCVEDRKLSWQIRVAWKRIQNGQEGKKTIEAEVETYEEELEDDGEDFKETSGEEREHLGMDPEETGKGHPDLREEEKGRPYQELKKKEVWEESDRNLEKISKEPETLVDELEREMEKILEAGKNSEDSEKEWKLDCEDGREEREMDREGFREEREEDYEGREEERTGIWQKITGFFQSVYQKIANLYGRIAEIPGKIGSAMEGLGDKIRGVSEKKDKILNFLSDEIHQTAFFKARDELLFLLCRLKPRKIQAEIQFGFEDPSLTGKVLAGLSMCYPFLGDGVDIRPDFGKKIFDGHLRIAGRLRISYFVKLLWKLVLSREVRMTYRHVRKFEL